MAGIPIAPPGLEYLLQVSQVHVQETRQSTFQSSCTFDLLGPDGQLVYQAAEQREWCGPRMALSVTNTQGYNVLNTQIPSECCSWETKLQVSSGSGELLGYIDKNLASMSTSFDILYPSGQVCLKVKGPGWGEAFMSDANYQILSADKTTQIGCITRVWRGLGNEMFSNKDNYVVTFPMDLHVNMKAMLVACALFIDLLCEEHRRSQLAHRRRVRHGGLHHVGIHHGGLHHGIHHGGLHHGIHHGGLHHGIHHGGLHHGIHHGGLHHGGIHHGARHHGGLHHH